MNLKAIIRIAVLLVALVGAQQAQACFFPPSVNWTGNVDSDWNNTANYSAVPANGDVVYINPANYTGAAAAPDIAAASAWIPRNIRVSNGGVLTIQANVSTSLGSYVTGSGSEIIHKAGTWDINGGKSDLDVYTNAQYTMTGGQLDVRDLQLWSGNTTFDYDGGTVNINDDLIVNGTAEINGSGITGVGATNTFEQTSGTVDFETTNTFPSGFETVTLTAGTVRYSGTNQTIADASAIAIAYNDLELAGSGKKSLGGDVDVDGDLTIESGVTLTATTSNYSLSVAGDFVNAAGDTGFEPENGAVTFDGGAAQTIRGNTSFNDIRLDNSAGVTIQWGDDTLQGNLSIANGTFTTNDSLVLRSDASGTASIGTIPGTGGFAGDIIMQRYIQTSTDGYRFLSSAVSGRTLSDWDDDVTTSGFPGSQYPSFSFTSVYGYDETASGDKDQGFVAPSAISDALGLGQGFLVQMGAATRIMDVKGAPNTGAVNFGVSYTDDVTQPLSEDGWNLVGNPYPATLDWDAASGWTKTNIDNAVYVWNATTGSWSTYVNGVSSNGGSRYIASSQGFWVKANAASPSLQVDEPAKSTTDAAFIKNNNSNELLKLTITAGGHHDEAIIYFPENGTAQFDAAQDAYKLVSDAAGVPNIATIDQDGAAYSINGQPELTGNTSIPVRVLPNYGTSATQTIALDSVHRFPQAPCLLLEDLYTGTITDLKSSDYTFILDDTTVAPRFVLHVSAPIETRFTAVGCNGAAAGAASIKGPGTGPWIYTWWDAQGNVIHVTPNSFEADTLTGLAPGNYAYTIVDNSGQSLCGTITGDFTIEAGFAMQVAASVADVTCFGDENGAIAVGLSGGEAPFTYTWGDDTTETSPARENLAAGTYEVLIVDANGCMTGEQIVVASPDPLVAAFELSTEPLELGSAGVAFAPENTSEGASDYRWDFGNGQGADVPDPVHTYYAPGDYNVTLTAINGTCESTYAGVVSVVEGATGIASELASDRIQLVHDGDGYAVAFGFSQPTVATLSLYNALGQLVWTESGVSVHQTRVPVGLPTTGGAYVLHIDSDVMSHTLKVVAK